MNEIDKSHIKSNLIRYMEKLKEKTGLAYWSSNSERLLYRTEAITDHIFILDHYGGDFLYLYIAKLDDVGEYYRDVERYSIPISFNKNILNEIIDKFIANNSSARRQIKINKIREIINDR